MLRVDAFTTAINGEGQVNDEVEVDFDDSSSYADSSLHSGDSQNDANSSTHSLSMRSPYSLCPGSICVQLLLAMPSL